MQHLRLQLLTLRVCVIDELKHDRVISLNISISTTSTSELIEEVRDLCNFLSKLISVHQQGRLSLWLLRRRVWERVKYGSMVRT
ncbi:hypothetical protein HanXRQr2_Chr15g0685851 [Helianthus annuus]|uniref:Uncharacterized protein n=1 Tax=Helianthus annuus TaxID=4232 RepID=A0A251S811_HELAN|nr:hypothetical protein HanXRQr2_Chr15g0685851 [Helianthus annuus]